MGPRNPGPGRGRRFPPSGRGVCTGAGGLASDASRPGGSLGDAAQREDVALCVTLVCDSER